MVITMAYLLVAAFALRALVVVRAGAAIASQPRHQERRGRTRVAAYRASILMWALLGVTFLVLGVNRQLDQHALLTELVRKLARAQGWYERRHDYQLLFVATLAAAAMISLAFLLRLTRDVLPRHALAFVGMVALACFLVVKTSSCHDVDAFLDRSVLGVEIRWLFEGVGIACVGVCALVSTRWYAKTRDSHRFSSVPVTGSGSGSENQ